MGTHTMSIRFGLRTGCDKNEAEPKTCALAHGTKTQINSDKIRRARLGRENKTGKNETSGWHKRTSGKSGT
jgi:hypothetical protein